MKASPIMAGNRLVLFLDFDGVMHPRVTKNEPLFCRMDLLSAWLAEHAHVAIVISSSWREFHPVDEMRSYFEGFEARVLGVTPMIHRIYGPEWSRTLEQQELCRFERQHEIELWMREHRPDGTWIALDDDDRLFAPACPNLVLVDHKTGLRPGTMFRLTKTMEHLIGGKIDR